MRNLFYPPNCLLCQRPLVRTEQALCAHCLPLLPRTNFHLQQDNPADQLFFGRIPVHKAAAFCFFEKGNHFRSLIHAFKYHHQRNVAYELGRLYAQEIAPSKWHDGIDLLIPVPLYWYKKWKRGYNQSEWIARGIASVWNIPVATENLHKKRNNKTQTRKSLYDRYLNATSTYALKQDTGLIGKHILLVDDVLTSGATLEACASPLLTIPDIKISILTLAFAE